MTCGRPSPLAALLPVVSALAVLGWAAEARAAIPGVPAILGDVGWDGLHLTEVIAGVAGSIRGCSQGVFGSFWGGVDPNVANGGCPGSGSLVLDIAFLSLLVVGVIAVVRIRQRSEQNRLD